MLVVDKPQGPTSHDIVHAVRRTFQIEKVGHGGTLDPMATGVLILLLGRATKMSEQLIGADKEYEGTMRLGIATDSHDAEGKVVREADPSGVADAALREEMKKLTGDLWQMPPMVSAVKVNGRPLYKSARQGLEVERKARLIHVYEFRLLAFRPPEADFRVRSTKGT
jgi:tRNA pseudouridine55 synthase